MNFTSAYKSLCASNPHTEPIKSVFTNGKVWFSLVSFGIVITCCSSSANVPTCLYLAGRLHPHACKRPSSFRTCSRTWRYCSRFCSRRADDVQSLRREATVLLLNLWLKTEAEGQGAEAQAEEKLVKSQRIQSQKQEMQEIRDKNPVENWTQESPKV